MAQFQRKEIERLTPLSAAIKEAEGENLRKLYQTYRKRAEQRLRDLSKKGFENLEIYQDYKNRFPRLTEIGQNDKKMLYDALAEVTRFLAARYSTPGGVHASMAEARSKLEEHHPELGSMPPIVFGEMMRSIKEHARKNAYYSQWQSTFRKVMGKAEKIGLTPEQLNEAVKKGQIRLGPAGGLYDTATQRAIRGKWAVLGK